MNNGNSEMYFAGNIIICLCITDCFAVVFKYSYLQVPMHSVSYKKHWDQYSDAYILKVLKSERLHKSPGVIIAILKLYHRSRGTFKLISNSVKACLLPKVNKKVIGGLCGPDCGKPPHSRCKNHMAVG